MAERVEEEEYEHDLLDQAVVPPFGLSATTLVAIALGGALGTLCRYLLETASPLSAGAFPSVTLAVNLSGSIAIGLLGALTEHASHRRSVVRPLLLVGFLGGWTTYSTLAVDALLLGKAAEIVSCLTYLTITVLGGLVLVVGGHAAGRRLSDR